MTIKVTGHQWYWEYTYPDNGNVDVESRYVHDEDLKPGQLRLLVVDNQLVIPAGKRDPHPDRQRRRHPSVSSSRRWGAQRHAIPGRTIELWLEVTNPARILWRV